MLSPVETRPATFSDSENLRLDNARQRILDRLLEGPATSAELNAICFRFGARIFELRQMGYSIDKKLIGRGQYLYTLTGKAKKSS